MVVVGCCYSEGMPVDILTERFGVDQSTLQKHARRHIEPRKSAAALVRVQSDLLYMPT